LISDENIYLLGNEKETMTRNTIFIIYFSIYIKKDKKKKQKDHGGKSENGKKKERKNNRSRTATLSTEKNRRGSQRTGWTKKNYDKKEKIDYNNIYRRYSRVGMDRYRY